MELFLFKINLFLLDTYGEVTNLNPDTVAVA